MLSCRPAKNATFVGVGADKPTIYININLGFLLLIDSLTSVVSFYYDAGVGCGGGSCCTSLDCPIFIYGQFNGLCNIQTIIYYKYNKLELKPIVVAVQ